MTESKYAPGRGESGDWETDAPIFFTVDDGDGGLPGLWMSIAEDDPTLEKTGRIQDFVYPADEDPDEEGWIALDYGANYYDEAMETQDPAFHQDRIDLFRCAELLYLWAAHRGNPFAHLSLGYVYSYDRCEGQYLGLDENGERICAEGEPFPHMKRAYECYTLALKSGHPEAYYKVGDFLSHGWACEADPVEAVKFWKRGYGAALELDGPGEPAWWGAAALRLGGAYEEGRGCTQSFEEAASWYETAVTGLEMAVDAGNWYYERSLASARAGLARCRQELG